MSFSLKRAERLYTRYLPAMWWIPDKCEGEEISQALDYLQTRVAEGDVEKLTETELLALIISNELVAEQVIQLFGNFGGMANQPLEKLLRFKGLGDAKIIRIAAVFEVAKRIVDQVQRS